MKISDQGRYRESSVKLAQEQSFEANKNMESGFPQKQSPDIHHQFTKQMSCLFKKRKKKKVDVLSLLFCLALLKLPPIDPSIDFRFFLAHQCRICLVWFPLQLSLSGDLQMSHTTFVVQIFPLVTRDFHYHKIEEKISI